MSKTKTPFFGLGSQGSIGGSITTQKRGSATLIRSKPIPTDPRSLGQAYQRWLYEDYVYLWHQASQATRDTYRSAGSRYHLTAFQYWMRYHLRNLPDILGWWKLDDNLGARTIDSSRNYNDLTVIGASPATGLINRCFSFDGVNDWLTIPNTSSLNITQLLTVEFFAMRTNTVLAFRAMVRKCELVAGGRQYLLEIDNINNSVNWRIRKADDSGWVTVTGAIMPKDIWVHYTGTFDGTVSKLYQDGSFVAQTVWAGAIQPTPSPFFISHDSARWEGSIDHVHIYNRALDPTEILRHSNRRYPL